ncbi:MAG: class II glutamine amidotransferase, partial [Candidatus Aenigmarchaeota archaeon]|nr:class II glutamine amidotransferase [Candidatus Aenigmarchaeota archaeon]
MCGIIGYYSDNSTNAGNIIIEGLKKMEYRGYDSWGFAIKTGKEIVVKKNVGSISEVKEGSNTKCKQAIGHTRWATHGSPTRQNAHPHLDCEKNIAIIHNGIIENFQSLKRGLIKLGYNFKSDTDTEVLAHLIDNFLSKDYSLTRAVQMALSKVDGAYGLAVIYGKEP